MMMRHLRFAFRREDEAPDAHFYSEARLVTHIDEAAIAAVTQLYREYLPEDAAVLDLMSSWVSHLPAEVAHSRVVGLGMNHTELAANPRLDGFVVHDLNRDPRLPFADAEFDAAAIAFRSSTSRGRWRCCATWAGCWSPAARWSSRSPTAASPPRRCAPGCCATTSATPHSSPAT